MEVAGIQAIDLFYKLAKEPVRTGEGEDDERGLKVAVVDVVEGVLSVF